MELYIEPIRPQRNFLNGRFLKGHVPCNKGKKWDEFNIDADKRQKMLECLKLGRKGQNGGGNIKVPVIGIKNGKIFGVFESSSDAYRKTGICDRNIRSVIAGERKRAGGVIWFKEKEIENWSKLIAI